MSDEGGVDPATAAVATLGVGDYLGMLRRHGNLAALFADQPPGSVRVALPAIRTTEELVLIDPALWSRQPIVSRLAARTEHAILDSPFVQINLGDRLVATPSDVPVPSLRTSPDSGHEALSDCEGAVRRLIWSGTSDDSEPTTAQVAHALCGLPSLGDRRQRIRDMLDVAHRLETVLVNSEEPGTLARTLLQ